MCPAHHSVENFAQAIRAIGEPIHNRTAEEISMAKLLTLLLEVTGLFDMRTRPELILLQKTMVVVEGVARGFDPQTRHVEGRRSGGARMDRAQSRPGRDASGRAERRRRPRPLLAGLPAIARAPVAVLEQLDDHDPRRADAVAGTIAAIEPDRGPQEPLAHAGALDALPGPSSPSCSRSVS